MKSTLATEKVTDAAVAKRTGKMWAEWFRILDAAGARKMSHPEIVAQLGRRYPKMDGWWQQIVTVGYEQARGLREKHQKPQGYQISGSKTLAVPLRALFRAWEDPRMRRRWLADADFHIRKATGGKSLRITWTDGKSSVDVNFYARGARKSQVAVQHGKLPDAKAAEKMKAYWNQQLGKLRTLLEG